MKRGGLSGRIKTATLAVGATVAVGLTEGAVKG